MLQNTLYVSLIQCFQTFSDIYRHVPLKASIEQTISAFQGTLKDRLYILWLLIKLLVKNCLT